MPTTMQLIPSSFPVELHWRGWRSDTLTLQKNGWLLSTNEQFNDHSFEKCVRIALRHPSEIYGYGQFSYPAEYFMERNYLSIAPNFSVSMDLAHHIDLISPYHVDLDARFLPIDAQPSMMEFPKDRISLEKVTWFREMPEKEVFLQEPSFHELMDKILDIQAPKQKELREKARKQSRIIRPDLATILRVAA